jgi:hypothetical protein
MDTDSIITDIKYDKVNNLELGKLKEEKSEIKYFLGLGAKMYFYEDKDGNYYDKKKQDPYWRIKGVKDNHFFEFDE